MRRFLGMLLTLFKYSMVAGQHTIAENSCVKKKKKKENENKTLNYINKYKKLKKSSQTRWWVPGRAHNCWSIIDQFSSPSSYGFS